MKKSSLEGTDNPLTKFKSMGVDKFLNTLSDEGSRDSEGEFTIALKKAAAKLAEFRLAKREDFALHLFQVAALSGAKRFLVTTEDDGRLCFFFDGEPMVSSDLVDTVENRTKGVSARIRQLQIVLSAVHSDEDTLFSVLGPEFSQTLVLNNGQLDFLPRASHTKEGFFLSTYWREPSKVLEGLRKLGCYSPVELRVKGESPNEPLDFGFQKRDVHAVFEVEGFERIATADPTLSSRKVWTQKRSEPESPFFYFALTTGDSKSTFHHISNGVILEKEEVPFDFPMISGAATVSHLPKDFSQSQLARKSEYEEFERKLEQYLADFLVSYCESEPKLPIDLQNSFCRQLRQFFEKTCPEAVQTYLAATESIDFILGKKKLKKFRREFGDEAGGLKIRRLKQLYEERAFEFWRELRMTGLKDLLDNYRHLIGKPGLTELGTLDCCKFLRDGRTREDWSDWSETGGEPGYRRFRAFLMSEQGPAKSRIKAQVENENWAALCQFLLLSPTQDGDYKDELLSQLNRFRSGDYNKLSSLCQLIETDTRTKDIARCWYWAVWKLALGKMSWFQQVKMIVQFSSSGMTESEFKWVKTTISLNSESRERESLRDLGQSHRARTFLALFVWSLPQFRTASYELVARQALLWESFHSIDARLNFDQPLPRKPFA